MRKMRLVPFVLSVLLIAGVLAVLPAPQSAKAAGSPQIVSKTPDTGSTMTEPWDGVVQITYDQPVEPSGVYDGSTQLSCKMFFIDYNTHEIEWLEAWSGYANGGDVTIDGSTVTIDMSYWGSDFPGDSVNRYGNDYRNEFYITVPEGAFVSADTHEPAHGCLMPSDYTIFVQTAPPQIVSTYPANGSGNIVATAGTEFSIVFDRDIHFVSVSPYPVIYQYDPGASSWAEVPKYNCTHGFSGNVYKFTLPSHRGRHSG